MFGIFLKRALGVIAFLVGLTLIGWFIYNQFRPTEEFEKAYRGVFQLIVPIACLIVGWRWMRYEGKGIEEITPPDLECPELDEAGARAQKTMPAFLEQVEKNIDGAFVKFPLQTPQGMTEHIWGYVHNFRDGMFNVSLANEPVDEEESPDGRRDVPVADVEDWQIMLPDGRIRGAQSLIALFRYHENKGIRLSPKMRKQKAQLVDAE